MGKRILASLVVFLCATALRAQESVKVPAGQEIWEAAYLEGARAGYFRTSFVPIEVDGQKLIRARQLLHLNVKRFDKIVKLQMESGTDETTDGKVVGVYMQLQGADGDVVLTGVVKDNVLHVEVKDRVKRQIPWNDKVIGMQAQEKLFVGKKFKAGDKASYQSFEPSLNAVVTVHATVNEPEEVDLAGKKRSLFRTVLSSDKIEVPGHVVQLPPITVWMDEKGLILRRQVEIPGLGKIVLVRTTRDAALAGGDLAKLVDIGLKALIPINKKIPRANDTTSAVYRITIDDPKPETALATDERQKIEKIGNKVIELQVKAVTRPPAEGKDEAGAEFLKSCFYLDSDNALVRELTARAVGDETDAWFKARRIEGWVRKNMTVDATVPFSPAGQVAKQLRGDCRQHAMLAAAMCRAAGVPSRTAIGVIYGEDRQGRPIFGFHMWAEVNVRGRWLGIDGTLGEGSVGAAHIKVTDHSWHDTPSLTPLLPLQRVIGKMKIEVVRYEH